MRIVIKGVAALLGAAGLLAFAAGTAGAIYVGRDDTMPLVAAAVRSDGAAVVIAPDLLAWWGPTLRLRAQSAEEEVFVGVAHRDDLDSYLEDTAHTVITAYAWPRSVSTREVGGRPPPTAPQRLDWWTASATGPFEATLPWPMTDGHFGLVIMAGDGREPADLSIAAELEITGLFATAVGVAGAGIGAVATAVVGLVLARRPRRPTETAEVAA